MKYSFQFMGVGMGITVLAVVLLAFVAFDRDVSMIRIAFLNIGQGDAILISHGSNQFLIDTGENGRSLLAEIGQLMPPWDRTIESVLLTHPDNDHVGGFTSLVSRYEVKTVLVADSFAQTENGTSVLEKIATQEIRRIDPRRGTSIVFAPEVILLIEHPDENFVFNTKKTNDSSIVVKLRVGKDVFLFTGDLEHEELVLPEEDIRVLKVAHHGSRYSTSDAFLDRMRPEEAIILVGKNSYGHPSQDVLDRLIRRNIRIFRTDTDGRIVYSCSIFADRSCEIMMP